MIAHTQLRRTIKATGAIIASPSHEFRDDPDGRFQENILASSYQHQREKGAEQTRNRMKARSSDGYWLFRAPLGYKFETIDGNDMLVRNPEGAPLPITETGYRSHFHQPGTIEARGGDVVAQVTAWLGRIDI